jgi:hypothetical protein
MRAHFDQKKCRLIPVKRKPTLQEETSQNTEKTLKKIDAMLEAQDRKLRG